MRNIAQFSGLERVKDAWSFDLNSHKINLNKI